MQVIALYSYKGGVGKSLLAANLAVALARCGKDTVLIDWDIDAPSAHTKLGVGDVALGRRGITGLVEDCVRPQGLTVTKGMSKTSMSSTSSDVSAYWDELHLNEIEFDPIPDLRNFVYDIPEVRDLDSKESGAHYGTIRLLPVGDIYNSNYWDLTWSSLWRDIFTVKHRFMRGKTTEADLRRVFDFLRSIREGFAGFDYMILDCRSGSSDLTTTVLNAFLNPAQNDKLLYLLGYNDDSITYLETFANNTKKEMRDLVVPVLCRVPVGFSYHLGDRHLRRALGKFRDWTPGQRDLTPLTPERLHILHSDRSLEADERIRMGLKEKPHDTKTLTFEYIRLFEKILPGEIWTKREFKTLAEALGLKVEDYQEHTRVFELDPDSGAMLNPNDDSRNVSFKVETFQFFLMGLGEELQNGAKDLATLLFSAGRKCGQKFGDALAQRNLARGDTRGAFEKVEDWCAFDSDVGFGRFSFDKKTITTSGQGLLFCSVRLHQSFLAPANDSKAGLTDHRYCKFVEGYIQGVFDKFLAYGEQNTFAIHHKSVERLEGQRADSCDFEIWNTVIDSPVPAPDWFSPDSPNARG